MRQRARRQPPAPRVASRAPSRWQLRFAALGTRRAGFIAASILFLVPCFWQTHLQAGDLSSHIYNSWLAQLIEKGQAPGLTIAKQTTNLLFDLMLGTFFRLFGAEAAQRIAVSIAVLVFVWGAFAFISAISGRRAWEWLPTIAMLAYGWVFHVGFFNFYLSLGMCFWALVLVWNGVWRRRVAAVPVLMLAWIAHALPVAWTLTVLAYGWALRRMAPRTRKYLVSASVLMIIVARLTIASMVFTQWHSGQLELATGLDQLRVFDEKYYLIFGGMLVIWILLGARLMRTHGVPPMPASLLPHICSLTALGIVVLPTVVQLPAYKHSIAFIADRMSLALAITLSGLLAVVQMRRWERRAVLLLMLLFFGFLYRDEHMLNAVEAQMTDTVSQLPPGQRVVSALEDTISRVNGLNHMIDRICLGRCYSYANYEPSTAQFRVRVTGTNPIVAASYEDSWRMQNGLYVVQDRDLPLYEINLGRDRAIVLRALRAGERCGITEWNPL